MKSTTLIAAVAVLLLGAFLRFHMLEVQSFWNDEGNSARLSERPINLIIEGTASDVHPPLYYLALHAWRAGAGSSEFGLRALSTLAGIMTVAVSMALTRSVSRRPAAVFLVAGLLTAVSPPLVYYAQEARMYALLALLAVFSTWALWQWLAGSHNSPARSRWYWPIAYTLSILAGLYTHYFFPVVIASQGLLVLLNVVAPSSYPGDSVPIRGRRFRVALAWGGAVAAALVGYAVWVPIFLRQIGSRPGPAQSFLDYLVHSGTWLSMGSTLSTAEAIWPVLTGLALVLMGIAIGRRHALAPFIMAAVPIGGSFVIGATDPAFFKFLLTAVPFLCVIAALAWRTRGWLRAIAALLSLLFVAGSVLSLANMYINPVYARADYRSIAARIAADARPAAAIILDAPNQWEVFTYYHREGAPVFPLPLGESDAAAIEAALAEIVAAHDRIYVLFWGDDQRDPQHVVERWLDAHTFKAAEEWVGDVRFVTYAVPTAGSPDAISTNYQFQTPDGAVITLESVGLGPQLVQPGDSVEVQLEWSADRSISQPLKVFIHMIDESGVPIAQRDSEPMNGTRPTTSWQPGEMIQDSYGLLVPLDIAPGSYDLVVGLYDAYDPTIRLQTSQAGLASDSIQIGNIAVR